MTVSANEAAARVFRGPALCPRADEGQVEFLPDAIIRVDANGRITAVEAASESDTQPSTHPGCVLLPGMVDTHIHFPQTRIIGSAAGPLLPWLSTAVFPEEARFSKRAYAEAVATEFCGQMLRQGTTCAAIYGSSHIDACDALFAELSRCGMKAFAGPALMNRGAPEDVLLSADEALAGLEWLRARWHGHDDRLWLSVVPRFALSCTGDFLERAGQYARAHGLLVQTHLSENTGEIEATAEAFPEARDYLAVYEEAGLVHGHSLFAHCIWLNDDQWDRMATAGAAVSHCPDSNFFLGSGCMHLTHALDRGVPTGLGTDVGAGRTFSLRRVAASAYDAALSVGEPVTPERLLWLATSGGARALGLGERIGRISTGFDADLIAVPVQPRTHTGDSEGIKRAILDALMFQHDAGPVAAVYLKGKPAAL